MGKYTVEGWVDKEQQWKVIVGIIPVRDIHSQDSTVFTAIISQWTLKSRWYFLFGALFVVVSSIRSHQPYLKLIL